MSKNYPEPEIQGSVNTITKDTVIKGNISAKGDFRLDGMLQGNMTLKGKLVVGESGSITGNVVCQNANIIGQVVGNITVDGLLSLHSTANVQGDIIINKLSIEPGASFSGTCRMLDEVKREKKEEAQPQLQSKPQSQPAKK